MRRRWLKRIVLSLAGLLVLGYAAVAIRVATYDVTAPATQGAPARLGTVAILGASGTAGDGILEAALANPAIETIHVITRRTTPRIDEGIAAGKVVMTLHMDYLDYTAIRDTLAGVDTVFWAIGLSSLGIDEEAYRRIHIDFPRRFVEAWLGVRTSGNISFHYISSSDISEDSSAMWARVKVEAEDVLFGLADDTTLRVIAYRPDYIGPTDEQAALGQRVLYGFFAPLGVAVKAVQIGKAMMEVTMRADEFENGAMVGTFGIRRYSEAYDDRQTASPPEERN